MSHAAPQKLRNITILDQQNVPPSGVMIIPSHLGYLDLLQLERILDGRPLVYLLAKDAAYSPELKAHLGQDQVHVQEFTPANSNIDSLRKVIQDAVKKASVVIYVPPMALAQKAALTTVSGARLEFLMQLRVPVLPLYVLDTTEVAMAIEPRPPKGDSVFAFGRVLPQADVP
ncbi:MAG: 2-acyl-glycerophospho-ethanolamine acyltransferase, partial [Verrucomicrobia bacterium]|nr:2-acyl-glycerophospho-ethanolamine acyltransferase [Verrucomicrobiota bacterium]